MRTHAYLGVQGDPSNTLMARNYCPMRTYVEEHKDAHPRQTLSLAQEDYATPIFCIFTAGTSNSSSSFSSLSSCRFFSADIAPVKPGYGVLGQGTWE